MGQAVNRGTFEERKELAIKRDTEKAKIRLVAKTNSIHQIAPTVEKKNRQQPLAHLMEMMLVIGARDIFPDKI